MHDEDSDIVITLLRRGEQQSRTVRLSSLPMALNKPGYRINEDMVLLIAFAKAG